jgi:hypothetical protein
MEIVKVDLDHMCKSALSKAINARMDELKVEGFEKLDLGFEIEPTWPFAPDKPLMSELVVIATNLKMKLVITGLKLVPMTTTDSQGVVRFTNTVDRGQARAGELEKRAQEWAPKCGGGDESVPGSSAQ